MRAALFLAFALEAVPNTSFAQAKPERFIPPPIMVVLARPDASISEREIEQASCVCARLAESTRDNRTQTYMKCLRGKLEPKRVKVMTRDDVPGA